MQLKPKVVFIFILTLAFSVPFDVSNLLWQKAMAQEAPSDEEGAPPGGNSGAPSSAASEASETSTSKPKKKKRKKRKNTNKNRPKEAEKNTPKPQRFEVLTVSDNIVAIEYTRAEPGMKIGDKMYVIHSEKKGFVAVLEIEQIEEKQKSLTARIVENDPEYADQIALSGLEVMTHKRFLVDYENFQEGPLYPEVPSTFKLFSQYANRNPTLFVGAGMGFSQYKETQFVVEEVSAPTATRSLYRAEVFLPEVFGQFWLNWFGGGYESYEIDAAILKVKDGDGKIIDEAQAKGSGSSAWVSVKPAFPYFIMSKLEFRFEVLRDRTTVVASPSEFALSEKSIVKTVVQDNAGRFFLGYQSRLANFGFLQFTGTLPLEPSVKVTQERANGSKETLDAKLKEVNVDGRLFLHLTFMEPPHQLSFDAHIGAVYDQKAYIIQRQNTNETIVTPYDLQPYVLFGISYVK